MAEVPFVSEDELLAKLEKWMAARAEPPNIFELIELGDRELMAAMLLKTARAATREAAIAKLDRVAEALQDLPAAAGNCAMRVFSSIADAWLLSPDEQQAVLGLETGIELRSLREMQIDDVPIAVIERVSVLLDISEAIDAFLPRPERACTWIREPRSGLQPGGTPALQMMKDSLDGLYLVRRYLLAEIRISTAGTRRT